MGRVDLVANRRWRSLKSEFEDLSNCLAGHSMEKLEELFCRIRKDELLADLLLKDVTVRYLNQLINLEVGGSYLVKVERMDKTRVDVIVEDDMGIEALQSRFVDANNRLADANYSEYNWEWEETLFFKKIDNCANFWKKYCLCYKGVHLDVGDKRVLSELGIVKNSVVELGRKIRPPKVSKKKYQRVFYER